MTGVHTIRTARKPYTCTEHSYHKIQVGDRYLYSAAPPWHDACDGKNWRVMRACLRCVERYGLHTSETRKLVEGAV